MGMAPAGWTESPLRKPLSGTAAGECFRWLSRGVFDSVHSKYCGCFWLNGAAQGSTCPLGTILNSTMIKRFRSKKECITACSYCEGQSVQKSPGLHL